MRGEKGEIRSIREEVLIPDLEGVHGPGDTAPCAASKRDDEKESDHCLSTYTHLDLDYMQPMSLIVSVAIFDLTTYTLQ